MNEQLLKTSGTDGLSFRKKTQKNILLSCNFRLTSDVTAFDYQIPTSEFWVSTSYFRQRERCNFLPSVFTFSNMAVANEKILEMRWIKELASLTHIFPNMFLAFLKVLLLRV